jgi:3(or 17)beta-hydroxysteroid dehydrogenase
MGRVKDRVALVTGGASGLGLVIAKRLAADGARVVITDFLADVGHAAAAEFGMTFIEQNVCDEARWPQVIQEAEERCGSVSILVNNAGILGRTDLSNPETTELEDWKKIFAVNVDGVLLGCRAAIVAMRKAGGGAIINMASITGLRASPHATAYGASKAAMRQLTKSVAQYCAEKKLKIRCNSVHPGIVRTALWEKYAEGIARARGITIEEFVEETIARIPLGDFTMPSDVAAAVSFLASDEARHITGAKLLVDGGIVNCETYRMIFQNSMVGSRRASASQWEST